jgi:hypothetical protein
MSRLSVLCRIAAFCVFSLAATAVQAHAATFCVADPVCVAEGHNDSGSDLGDGLADAAANAGDDKVRVGPGSYEGPFAYAPPGNLELVGAGDATVLHLPAGSANTTLLQLDRASVSSLRLAVGAGNANTGASLSRSSTEDLSIEFAAGSTNSVGVFLEGGTLRAAHITTPPDANSVAVATGSLPYHITESDLRSGIGVLSFSPLLPARIDATRIDAPFGIIHHCGKLFVDDTLIAGEDMVTAAWARDTSCAGDTELTLRHTTIAGAGDPGSTGVMVQAGGAGNEVTVRVVNSIIHAVGHAMIRTAADAGKASLIADWVSWVSAGVQSSNISGGTGALAAGEQVGGAPGFADPAAGDFRLRADSVLVDAGDPVALQPDEPATDLEGRPRLAARYNGGAPRRDLGAFERSPVAPPAPPAPPVPPGTPAPPGAAPAPLLSVSAARRQRALKKGVVLVARSDMAVALRATGRLRIAGRRRTIRLRTASAALTEAGTSRLVLRVPARKRSRVKRALTRRARVKVALSVTATTTDGRTAKAARTVRVVRR